MSVSVLVPWLGGCPHREAALRWLKRPHTLATGGEPWSKGGAVMPAIERSSSEIIVVTDADVFTEGIEAAVRAVEGGAKWAIPHRGVHRLTQDSTQAVLNGADPAGLPLEQPAYLGIEGGGAVVARRETLLDIPLDRRFIGWGQEDESWGVALRTLLGAPKRIKQPLYHLWHPPQKRLTRSRGSIEGWQLRRRYLMARNDPAQMRALLDEVKDAHSAHQPQLHSHQAA